MAAPERHSWHVGLDVHNASHGTSRRSLVMGLHQVRARTWEKAGQWCTSLDEDEDELHKKSKGG
jgi:hypothetical protein